jgi:hypothetical protein
MDRKKLSKTIAVLVGVVFLVSRCGRVTTHIPGTPTVISVTKELRPEDKSKVVVGNGSVVVVDHTHGTVVLVPPDGRVETTIKKDGTVVTRVKNKGLTAHPGIGVAVFGGHGASPVLDCRVAYWNRAGLTVGLGLKRETVSRPYLAATYQVYSNTHLFLGCSIAKDVVVGVRISF